MKSASLTSSPAIRNQLIAGYDNDGKTPIPYWHILYRPSGGMNVKPREMAQFLKLLIGRGRVDGEQIMTPGQIQRAETQTTTLSARAGLDFGYGLGIYQTIHEGFVLNQHGGDADGYLAHFAYSHDSKRGYFLVINAFNHQPLRAMKARLNDALVFGLEAPPSPPVADVDSETLNAYVGEYHAASTRFPAPGWEKQKLVVRQAGNGLETRQGEGGWRALLPVDRRLFRRSNEPVATAAFFVLDDGKVVLQGRMGNWIREKKS